jgi:hypothetical protein
VDKRLWPKDPDEKCSDSEERIIMMSSFWQEVIEEVERKVCG